MNTSRQNPYIGPRTFQRDEGHLFFGRDSEAADLEALVASEKLVLFYAQSGAGKSSLINARLIPSLEEKLFEVLPVARVSGDSPRGVNVENIYAYNLVRSLLGREIDPQLLSTLTLCQLLERLNEDEDGYFYDPDLTESIRSTVGPTPWPRALVIDQFEEIFSTNVEAWQKREDFFRQLAQAMQEDPYLWVILVMREDFIASLDPYAHLLPGGLRVRYYMERLSHEAAIQAIRSPVERVRPYAKGVAEKLAEDLSRVKVQKPDGTTGTEPGQYIEPVQLQVVCYSLWENLPPEGEEITEKDLLDVGDVNQSLARYYDRRVSEVARAKNIKERQIREWFDQKLITAGGIRNMVLQERDAQPGELDDRVIQALQSDLVRAEKRGGATWYELTHDRLVEPILASNKKWFELNLSPLQRQALLWDDQGRNDNWLLRDQAYTEVLPWVEEHQDELTGLEKEFLEACRKQQAEEQARHEEQARSAKRMRRFTVAVSAFAILSFLLLIFAIVSNINANAAEEKTKKQAQFDRALANSVSLREKNFLLSLLLGVEAFKGTEELFTFDLAQSALLDNAQANPQLEQFLSGHEGPVLSVAFSPDGKVMASGSYDHPISLWDVETRKPIGQLSGHTDIVRSVAFSPDGKMLASASEDKTIILWDLKTQKPIGEHLRGHSDVITSVAFSPDGKMLASSSNDKTIILWDVKTHEPIGQPLKGHTDIVLSVTFSPDGKMLASSSYDTTIILWNVKTHKPIGQPLKGHLGTALSVAFSPDGKTLASGGYDKTIILWDVATRKLIDQLSGHTDTVRSVVFSPDGNKLASGSYDRTIILWDLLTHQAIGQPLRGHSDLITSVAFRPDGKTMASSSGDRTIILWDVEARLPISEVLNGTDSVFHAGPVFSLAFSRDGKTLASGSYDNTIILWDMETHQPIGQLSGHSGPIFTVTFSPDGRTLASGGCTKFDTQGKGICIQGEVILWDVKTSQPKGQPLTWHTNTVTSVAFSPDGSTLASGGCKRFDDQDACIEGEVILWDVRTSQPKGQPLTEHTNGITSVAFSPDGRTLAFGSEDKTTMLWDIKSGKPIGKPLSGHEGSVLSVVFSPDGKMLASGSYDRTIILWDVKTRQPIGQPLSGHSGLVVSVKFSPDSKMLASGSYDKTIILWDVGTHQPIAQPLSGHAAPVQSIAFHPDGTTLASSSHNIVLWDLDPQSWIERSCLSAGRNFTRAEWERYFPNENYRKTCDQWPLEPETTPTPEP